MLRPLAVVSAMMLVTSSAQAFHMEDSLRGGTQSGNPVGGAFESEGWRVTERRDRIWYALPRLASGSVEFTITNLSHATLTDGDNEMFAMYEAGYGMAEPISYSDFRLNHYKIMLRIYGLSETGRVGAQKLMWGLCPSGAPGNGDCGCGGSFDEPYAGFDGWDGAPTRIRIEWGNGHTRYFRNGQETIHIDWSDTGLAFGPDTLHMSLGTSRPSAVGDAALPPGILFSDLVVDGEEGPLATCGGTVPGSSSSSTGGVVVPPTGNDNAAIVGQSLPSTGACGQRITGNLTLQNTGETTWMTPYRYRLVGLEGTAAAGNIVELIDTEEHVDPQESYTFPLAITLPSTPGQYSASWRMRQDPDRFFGSTAQFSINVTCDVPASSSSAAPPVMTSSSTQGASSAGTTASSSMGTSSRGPASSSGRMVSMSGAASSTSSEESDDEADGSNVGCTCAAPLTTSMPLGLLLLGVLVSRRRGAAG